MSDFGPLDIVYDNARDGSLRGRVRRRTHPTARGTVLGNPGTRERGGGGSWVEVGGECGGLFVYRGIRDFEQKLHQTLIICAKPSDLPGIIQGSSSGWGCLQIPGASKVKKREQRLSKKVLLLQYVHKI